MFEPEVIGTSVVLTDDLSLSRDLTGVECLTPASERASRYLKGTTLATTLLLAPVIPLHDLPSASGWVIKVDEADLGSAVACPVVGPEKFGHEVPTPRYHEEDVLLDSPRYRSAEVTRLKERGFVRVNMPPRKRNAN